MKLVVISPEGDDPREIAVLGALFAAGLERYHVRKPRWSALQLEGWLRNLPVEWRSRLVLHQHQELVELFELGGRHWRDEGKARQPHAGDATADGKVVDAGITSRSCHDLTTLRAALGHYDAVFFSPIFPSISKPGYGPAPDFSAGELAALLRERSEFQRRTEVIALGGIDADNAARALELGFDGVAVLGALWQSPDPIRVFASLAQKFPRRAESSLDFRAAKTPIMGLTSDGLAIGPVEQAERLCAAGARWIQLRMKNSAREEWTATARRVVAVCRAHRATCIINDSVDVALAAEADGVHLGKLDLDWREARARLGASRLLGGTVNNAADAAGARAAGCLDYVGVGPLRFTPTKQKLAPVLGLDGVRELIAQLDGLPAWVIGGVEAADLPGLRAAGAAGAAVTGALYRDGRIEENFRALVSAWDEGAVPARAFSTHGAGEPGRELISR
ncbi:MAG: hypothetical protein EXS38_02895 [Opitutus sp.]|nr:hypothetical protein [Opitutus sp.]